MNQTNRTSGQRGRLFKAGLAVGCVALVALAGQRQPPPQAQPTVLKLSILDADSGLPTPARVEVLDPQGKPCIAADALPVGGD